MIFLVKCRDGELKYKLYFDKHHPETITLPAPSLFNLYAEPHIVPWSAVQAYRNPTPAPEPEPQDEPHDYLFILGIQRRLPASGSRNLLHHSMTLASPTGIRQAIAGNRPT